MEFEDGRIQGFKLKFKNVSDDTERYMFALVDLLEAGKIEKVPDIKEEDFAAHLPKIAAAVNAAA